MTRRLNEIGVPVAAARKDALTTLAAQLHLVVLADLNGIHIRAAVNWRNAVAASRSLYVVELLQSSVAIESAALAPSTSAL